MRPGWAEDGVFANVRVRLAGGQRSAQNEGSQLNRQNTWMCVSGVWKPGTHSCTRLSWSIYATRHTWYYELVTREIGYALLRKDTVGWPSSLATSERWQISKEMENFQLLRLSDDFGDLSIDKSIIAQSNSENSTLNWTQFEFHTSFYKNINNNFQ